MELKIEKGIPLPAKKSTSKPLGVISKTCLEMEIGDSFYCEKTLNNLHAYFAVAKKSGRKFTCRTEGTGTRVWRVA